MKPKKLFREEINKLLKKDVTGEVKVDLKNLKSGIL